jgi:hypothetical protein
VKQLKKLKREQNQLQTMFLNLETDFRKNNPRYLLKTANIRKKSKLILLWKKNNQLKSKFQDINLIKVTLNQNSQVKRLQLTIKTRKKEMIK